MCHHPNKTESSPEQKWNYVLLLHLPPSTLWAQSNAHSSGCQLKDLTTLLIPTELGSLALGGETRELPAPTGSTPSAWCTSTARAAIVRTGHMKSVWWMIWVKASPALPAESTEAKRFISSVCCFDEIDFNDIIKWPLIAQQWYLFLNKYSFVCFSWWTGPFSGKYGQIHLR